MVFRTFRSGICCPNLIGTIIFIIFLYIIHVIEYIMMQNIQGKIVFLIIFHILFSLLIWSFISSIISDPGSVPTYWGLYSTAIQSRKYCLICHGFKPQRCHHCSTCGQCVLNMDHHCPWLNNCVGFYNRKFFMLFLFYTNITMFYILIYEAILLIIQACNIFHREQQFTFHSILRLVGFLFGLAFLFIIIMFIKYHTKLVLKNDTTLDQIIRNKTFQSRKTNYSSTVGEQSDENYDLGTYHNFTQVFSKNPFYWFIPLNPSSSQMNGDGIIWIKNNENSKYTLSKQTTLPQQIKNNNQDLILRRKI